MKTEESKLEVQQEQLDIPVVSVSIKYLSDIKDKFKEYAYIHGDNVLFITYNDNTKIKVPMSEEIFFEFLRLINI